MTYLVKEIFGPTVQGEGAHAGMSCVFLRFAVCNLACSWCDTDFSRQGANKMTAKQIAEALVKVDTGGSKKVVVTGGEPALQWDETIHKELAGQGFTVHMETNGTTLLQAPVDWLTVSPKPQFHENRFSLSTKVVPSECKVVVDDSVDDAVLQAYQKKYPLCQYWYVQPCMDDRYDDNLKKTLSFVSRYPSWRLSVQMHKVIGVP